jgi:hypothetical protein
MNFIKSIIAIGLLVLSTHAFSQDANHAHRSTVKADTVKKKSIAQEEHAQIGATHITLLYSAPAVRGRIIWGGLVAYDQVWVTGAHRATSFEIDHEFSVDGKKIPAGKYAIFTIPGKDKWIFVLNKKWDQHLADEYDSAEDVLRVEVTPRTLPEVQERLSYSITELSETEAILSISWEKIKINIPLKLNAH